MKAKFVSKRLVSIYTICVALCLSLLVGLPTVSFATTTAYLHTPQQNSTVTNTGESCPTLTASETLSVFGAGVNASELDSWHFVLPGTDTTFVRVYPEFSGGAKFAVTIRDFGKHSYIYTKVSDRAILINATADVDGPQTRFVLSHTCPGSAPVTQCQTPLNNRTPFSTELTNLTSRNVNVTILSGNLPAGWNFVNVTDAVTNAPIAGATLNGSTLSFTLPAGVSNVNVNFSTSLVNCSPPNISLTFSFQNITCTNPIILNPDGGSLGTFNFDVSSAPTISSKISGTISNVSALGIEYKLTPTAPNYFGVTVTVVLDSGSTPGYVEISGRPSRSGTLSFGVEASKGPCSTFRPFEISFTQSCSISTLPSSPNLPVVLWNNLRVGTALVPQVISVSPSSSASLIDSYSVSNYSTFARPPSGINLDETANGVNVSGNPGSSGSFAFQVTANFKDPACNPISQIYFMTIDPAPSTACTITPPPSLPAKTWAPFRVGDSINDRIAAILSSGTASYSVESIGNEDLPAGISFGASSSGVTIRGRFAEAGTYFFTITADLNRTVTNCNPVSNVYSLTVQPVVTTPSTPPSPNSTPTPNPTPTERPTVSPTPSPTVTPEDEPTSSPRPTPTVTVTVTASPASTSTPQSIATPVPTPTRTTTIELAPPTAARSRSAIAINCGEAVTLDLKALTADGSTFEITSLPKTGKILQPTPDVLIYIPDKEQCALGGNDTFSYALKDKNGNVKTVEKIVTPVVEGDMPKWIRTGYVGGGMTVGNWLALSVLAYLGIALFLSRRKKVKK